MLTNYYRLRAALALLRKRTQINYECRAGWTERLYGLGVDCLIVYRDAGWRACLEFLDAD